MLASRIFRLTNEEVELKETTSCPTFPLVGPETYITVKSSDEIEPVDDADTSYLAVPVHPLHPEFGSTSLRDPVSTIARNATGGVPTYTSA